MTNLAVSEWKLFCFKQHDEKLQIQNGLNWFIQFGNRKKVTSRQLHP